MAIKKSLHFENPDMAKCLELLAELYCLGVAPLMLKKQPDIVTTIRKLMKYVGPSNMEGATADEWGVDSQKIRLKAKQIFMKMQSSFAVPEGVSFWDAFETEVVNFRDATNGMERNKILAMVKDPVTSGGELIKAS